MKSGLDNDSTKVKCERELVITRVFKAPQELVCLLLDQVDLILEQGEVEHMVQLNENKRYLRFKIIGTSEL